MTPVAVVGVGESRVGRLRGLRALRLTLEAARAAVQDAGVAGAAIDGVLTRNLDMDVTHMHLFGTSSRQLGMIAVAQRRYASQNPNADLRTALSLEEYERSPWLIAPLRKYDLAYLFDGGAAFVVAALPWARDHTPRPVPILGLGQAHSGAHMSYCAPMVTSTTTPAQQSGQEAFRTAGVGP